MKRDLLSIHDLSPRELTLLLDSASALKKRQPLATNSHQPLMGQAMALLFEKPSLRTRLSFELAMKQLGGETIFISPGEVGLGVRESVADVARTLSSFVDVVVGRVFMHATLEELARASSVPVINGLSDLEHPCQALADLLTLSESLGELAGRTLAYVGDGNNVASSLMFAAPMVGINVCIASPAGYEPPDRAAAEADQRAREHGAWVEICRDPAAAVRNADAVYADAWYSMGQEHEAEVRRDVFRQYQVNAELLEHASSGRWPCTASRRIVAMRSPTTFWTGSPAWPSPRLPTVCTFRKRCCSGYCQISLAVTFPLHRLRNAAHNHEPDEAASAL